MGVVVQTELCFVSWPADHSYLCAGRSVGEQATALLLLLTGAAACGQGGRARHTAAGGGMPLGRSLRADA